MNMKRAIRWGVGLIAVAVIGLYGEYVREKLLLSPSLLLACADVEREPGAWTCRQILLRRTFTTEEIAQLNRDGGALFPVLAENPALAEEMLALFIERGVDVNAGEEKVRHWTALHAMAIEGDLARVQLLLRHGARADLQDSNGMTALDFARKKLEELPSDPGRKEIVRLLEEAASRRAG